MPAPGAEGAVIVSAAEAETRLDRFCVARWPVHSRMAVQAAIKAGDVTVNGARSRPGARLAAGDRVDAIFRPRTGPVLTPEPRPLTILLDDPAFLVVDKPAGLPTHPGPGHSRGSLVNALLALGGPLSTYHEDPLRPGVVHRLDRDTTGVIVIAKNERAHAALAAQFQARTVQKTYLALVFGVPEHDEFRVDRSIGRDPRHRLKMAVDRPGGRASRTRFRVRERFRGFALVAAFPETGRTHQIRVHLAAHGTPVLADPFYGRPGLPPATASWLRGAKAAPDELPVLARTALHALRLEFAHPVSGAPVAVEAPLPVDFAAALAALRARR